MSLAIMGPTIEPSKFEGGADSDWQKYVAHRPTYSDSFYDVNWDYHRSHGDRRSLAHDVGTGPGSVAKVLAGRFDNVVATDPSEHHTVVARKLCEGESVTGEFTYIPLCHEWTLNCSFFVLVALP